MSDSAGISSIFYREPAVGAPVIRGQTDTGAGSGATNPGSFNPASDATDEQPRRRIPWRIRKTMPLNRRHEWDPPSDSDIANIKVALRKVLNRPEDPTPEQLELMEEVKRFPVHRLVARKLALDGIGQGVEQVQATETRFAQEGPRRV